MGTPIDRLAAYLNLSPDQYDASDSEQAIVLAIEQADLSVADLLNAVHVVFSHP